MSSSDEEGSDSSQDYGEEREELEAKEGEAAIDSVPTTNMASMQHDGEDTDLKEAARSRAQVKTKKRLLSAMEKAKKKGVVYMSRIPPHLKPLKLRHMLSQYGEVGRLYLAPEDPSLRKRRKKLQGNTGKMFSEGWIEFADKGVAKKVVDMLNGNPMGGKKRSAYHYDIWCLKYLPKFKWDHLTEEIAYQNAIRDQKLANEISAAKRERDFYMSRVDHAKAEEAKEKRRKRKLEEGGEKPSASAGVTASIRNVRAFGQRSAKSDSTDDANAKSLPKSVLALLAGKPEA